MQMRLATLLSIAPFLAVSSSASVPPELHVSGTQIRNVNGASVRLTGVNAASLEWSSNGEGHILETARRAVTDWHANIVRLPLSQDRWFGTLPEQHDGGEAYRSLVKSAVDEVTNRGAYVLLDLHWNDGGDWFARTAQHLMPDKNSKTFWSSLASAYRNHPAVLFDLYNEPHDVSWQIWRDGGTVTERGRGGKSTYQAVGIQELLDVVRRTGARNVVVAGGLDWAYDMSGFLKGFQLRDPDGNGVIYANHSYPIKGDSVATWIAKMEKATAKIPVIVSEFGSASRDRSRKTADPWVAAVLQALQKHHWNWTAWDLHPAAGPTLISDWKYTPTPSFGAPVLAALSSHR